MENLKTAVRRFFYMVKNRWLVFDNLALIICLILCAWWTYGSIDAMTRNWELENTLNDKKRELALLSLEVDTLVLENNYYKSKEYQELSARSKLNKKSPDETLVYLPDNTDYAKNKHRDDDTTIVIEESNMVKWFDFLF